MDRKATMPTEWGWSLAGKWIAVETVSPYRFIGVYSSRELAVERASEFGSPAEFHPCCSLESAQATSNMLRIRREGH
jgi:hypothetical protein